MGTAPVTSALIAECRKHRYVRLLVLCSAVAIAVIVAAYAFLLQAMHGLRNESWEIADCMRACLAWLLAFLSIQLPLSPKPRGALAFRITTKAAQKLAAEAGAPQSSSTLTRPL